jgi:hypothetical protein
MMPSQPQNLEKDSKKKEPSSILLSGINPGCPSGWKFLQDGWQSRERKSSLSGCRRDASRKCFKTCSPTFSPAEIHEPGCWFGASLRAKSPGCPDLPFPTVLLAALAQFFGGSI